jgi:hypothetical protein
VRMDGLTARDPRKVKQQSQVWGSWLRQTLVVGGQTIMSLIQGGVHFGGQAASMPSIAFGGW